ncbi:MULTISPECIES: hypothetical protein [Streptomyces]|uniref:DUF998 domain-containing protein n=1 Tax=Streptomyces dengpaensis TaxID=2049881 RepID=A0ABN5I1G3_9ACTN|nr:MULTISPECIES: hypothetical protein [Streptomyces]AVH55747.1 hypothetical protein C4B68_08160 [Streptomyces dengpaensis]PIB12006.1 hypothetical protein B1C81_02100 [Streptomyces sp. HG99]
MYAAVLGVSPVDRSYVDLLRLDSAPVPVQMHTVAAWLLMALTLLWLAHRRSAVYARAAIALLLASAAGLIFAGAVSLPGLPVPEGSLVRDYLALPGALAGWYVLAGLAVAAGLSAVRARIVVLVVALSAVTIAVLTSDHRMLSAVWAAGVPLVAWCVAGLVQRPETSSRGPVDAWEPDGRTVPFRPRPDATGQWGAPLSEPLREAS